MLARGFHYCIVCADISYVVLVCIYALIKKVVTLLTRWQFFSSLLNFHFTTPLFIEFPSLNQLSTIPSLDLHP
jgi:hypothetical protein